MNKFITTDNGGLPLQLDDLRFIDDSVRNALKGILSAYGIDPADSFILSGCAVTSGFGGVVWDVAAGYISLDGEVLEVTAHSITKTLLPGEKHVWRILTTNDPAGLKTFQSTVSYNTYQIRQAEVVAAVPGGAYMPMLAPSIFDQMNFSDIKTGLGISQADSASTLKYNKVDIGAWDMDATVGTNVTLPGGGLTVLDYTIIIYNDAGTDHYNFEASNQTPPAAEPNGRAAFYAGGVNLNRTASGFFDSTAFNDGVINRGHIFVTYE